LTHLTRIAFTIGLLIASAAGAQAQSQVRVEGQIHDFTGPMTPPDPLGPWQIDGDWSITLDTASGRVEFATALNMIRSDNVTRAAHTHHVRMIDPQITPIANGYRLSGTASFTSNGAPAGFSGSPVDVEITGGSALAFATVKVKFGGGAAAHFGDAALGGVVGFGK